MLLFVMFLYQFCIWKCIARIRPLPFNVAFLLQFLMKVRLVRILYAIVCLWTLHWLFFPAWDAIKLTLKVGFISPFISYRYWSNS